MVNVKGAVARETMVSESETCTVNCAGTPGVVGVPEMMPSPLLSVLMVSPSGRAPCEPLSHVPLLSMTHQVYGIFPPVAVKVAL